jgi:hydroxymethylpyrimidine pyrophosphatase-like HAD family hydrolase
MGTAPEHVKSVADYVTEKQEEGGLVKVLSEIMENRTE